MSELQNVQTAKGVACGKNSVFLNERKFNQSLIRAELAFCSFVFGVVNDVKQNHGILICMLGYTHILALQIKGSKCFIFVSYIRFAYNVWIIWL